MSVHFGALSWTDDLTEALIDGVAHEGPDNVGAERNTYGQRVFDHMVSQTARPDLAEAVRQAMQQPSEENRLNVRKIQDKIYKLRSLESGGKNSDQNAKAFNERVKAYRRRHKIHLANSKADAETPSAAEVLLQLSAGQEPPVFSNEAPGTDFSPRFDCLQPSHRAFARSLAHADRDRFDDFVSAYQVAASAPPPPRGGALAFWQSASLLAPFPADASSAAECARFFLDYPELCYALALEAFIYTLRPPATPVSFLANLVEHKSTRAAIQRAFTSDAGVTYAAAAAAAPVQAARAGGSGRRTAAAADDDAMLE